MHRFHVKTLVLCSLLLQAGFCLGTPENPQLLTVPAGTCLRVALTHRCRLRKGSLIAGRLLEPIYAENRLLLPSGNLLSGTVSAVLPARRKRLDAKFHGDFTPLHEPVIQWTTLVRTEGEQYPLNAESTSGAAGTLYFRSAPGAHTSLARRAWDSVVGRKNAAVDTVKAPHKGERLEKFFWSQMPYHPEYLEDGTQYEMTLTSELQLPSGLPALHGEGAEEKPLANLVSVHSRLRDDIDSANSKAGDPVEAVVTQPVMDAQNQLIIPMGSILHGTVVRSVPSQRWGHNGSLRFSFDKISWPSGYQQDVEATPTAVESGADAKLALDQEGGVARQTDRSVAAPLVMGLLSASAIGDDDGGLGKAAVSSNGFALIGRLIAIGTSSRYVGGTIGAIATARSIYTRWLAHGKDTHFGKDTEVVLEMSPAHAHRMSPVR